jgi:hypothetical protein
MENRVQAEWMKEVYGEFQSVHKAIANSEKVVLKEIANNREEFVIFKTKVNTRTAMISTAIGTVVLITSLLLNISAIKERKAEKDNKAIIELVE